MKIFIELFRRPVSLALLVVFSSACSQQGLSPTAALSERAASSVGCAQAFEDDFWDGLYDFILLKRPFASRADLAASLEPAFERGRLVDAGPAERAEIRAAILDLYDLLTVETVAKLGIGLSHSKELLGALTALEVGDRTSPEKTALQNRIRASFEQVQAIATRAGMISGCPAPVQAPSAPLSGPASGNSLRATNLLEQWSRSRHPAVYGGLKALATAYQSCEAGVLPAIVKETPDTAGISIVGKHPDGVGNRRMVTDLSAFLRTEYYLKQYLRPQAVGCFDVQKSPMIYDYGGKPYTDTAPGATLDFFKNAGSGTSVLGIDCSGFVFSAFASAGLKFKKAGRLKPIDVYGIPARMYLDPQTNGLTCFDRVRMTKTEGMAPGDVVASAGHIFIIESVGADPFGIARITNPAECRTENISAANFDFTILQSSPTKGGIGINKIRAADYLPESKAMLVGLIDHAVSACLARTTGKSVMTKSSSASLVRHLGTPECSTQPVRLAREECVSSCAVPGFGPS
jgi:hypothetical protein